MEYSTIGACRVCGESDLTHLFSLGDHYVNDFPLRGKERSGPSAPLELVMCSRCSLVQLRHTARQEFLYSRHYWYRSGVTDTMRVALADVTDKALRLVSIDRRDVALDIGSNDGTLLRTYPDQVVRVGVEPALNLAEEGARDIDILINDFWDFNCYWRAVGRRAKVITAIGMFYDLENPNQFIADVADALSLQGIFVSQLMCLRNMLTIGDVGNINHEHLEYYSLRSLRTLFGRHGLEIIDIEENDVNGQSYRIYSRLTGSTVQPAAGAEERLNRIEVLEEGLDTARPMIDFYREAERNRHAICALIARLHGEGKRIWVYGASTKGNTLLQYWGLKPPLIEAAADRSPEKWGRVTVGTGIPIVSEDEARQANPDYFLVLPYAFLDEFLRRESEWRSKGGRFIVPLPNLRVL